MVKNKLVSAVNLALAASAASALAPDAALAQQQPAVAATNASNLEEVIVTGSRVRRVDAETASPVFVLDAATISQTGAITVGDLVSRIPSIGGQATNPSINNGGGFGESNIELRGLDSKRTLILIDGKRVNLAGASGSVDVNQIPLNLIDHVDVLKEGAGAIYGSDAIAGVVNFVTRTHVDGLELTGDWGETSKHDAQHHNVGLLFGGGSERMTFEVGANYNQQDELTMGARQWSKYALYLYSGTYSKGGSSRIGTGRVYLTPGLQAQYGCKSVTRKDGAAGTALTDYRCLTGSDRFNYQPYNLNLTPQERGALFTKVNYKINDYAEVYTSVIYNHTHSGFQLAPLPFDALNDDITISAQNAYNPFGYDLGGASGANPNYTLRMLSLGDRRSDSISSSLITTTGVKGKILDTGWNYDVNGSYNRLDQTANIYGYLLFSGLRNAVGPSFLQADGSYGCGASAATQIAGCVPLNLFNPTAPSQVAGLKNITASYTTENKYVSKTFNLDFNGTAVHLPAGDLLLDVGFSYTGLDNTFQTSTLSELQGPNYLNCQISQEACRASSQGSYNFKEGYGEAFIPVLANMPGVQSLNVDLGFRYSDYSAFGNTSRAQFKVEYHPIKDLLVRGTYAQIFRAPTLNDAYSGASVGSPTLNDPCNGYKGAATALYPNLPAACAGVATDGSFAEPNNQVTGKATSNPNLKPETGDVKTFGFVYDPSYIRGLSLSVDYWDYTVKDLLTTLDPNYIAQQCATSGTAEFCSLLHRYQSGPNAGQFLYVEQPTANLGTLKTNGVDFSVKYLLKNTGIGDFNLAVDVTHLNKYENTPAPGLAPVQIAGTYNKQFGFYAKNRGTLSIGWGLANVEALLTARYIGGVNVPLTNFDGTNYLGTTLSAVEYYDLTAGYLIKQTNTKLRVGILNLADKTPPIGGINSFAVGSSVTDVTTYDTVGRRFYVGFTQKF